jgi:hypothetical protein
VSFAEKKIQQIIFLSLSFVPSSIFEQIFNIQCMSDIVPGTQDIKATVAEITLVIYILGRYLIV